VRLSDNQYRPVEVEATPVEDAGKYRVTLTLKPGVYSVQVTLGASSDSEWVSIRSGKETVLPVERWADLSLASAAPLQPANPRRGTTLANYAAQAQDCSKRVTWQPGQSGSSRLFIFIHTPDVEKYPGFSQGLTLLDAHGTLLVSLSGDAIELDASRGWAAFTTDLPSEFYILRRTGPEDVVYDHSLYLCEGWETQVFMAGGKGPSFRSLTMHMAPYGHGFRHDDETAAASDAVLDAFRQSTGMGALLASSHLRQLLRGEYRNPWLAVLAAYALTVAEGETRRPYADRSSPPVDASLKAEIIQFLQGTIPAHPDVKALSLDWNTPSPGPFEVPTLMRVGLARVQKHATRFAATIPVGSLTDRLLTRQVTASPWCVWRGPAPQPLAIESQAAEQRDVPVSRERASNDLRRVLYNFPLIETAQQLIQSIADVTPEKIVINVQEEADKLLARVEPREFSAAAGVPLGRTERVLDSLKNVKVDTGTLSDDTPGGIATERVILEYALRKSTRSERKAAPTIRSAELSAAANPAQGGRQTLEDYVGALKDAADQLTRSKPVKSEKWDVSGDAPDEPLDPVIQARAHAVAVRLRRVARELLRLADIVAITNTNGEFQYGNGAFTLLMAFADSEQPLRASQQWSQWLSTLPLGQTQQHKLDLDSVDRQWTVRRTAVEDQRSGATTAYVNIFNDTKPPERSGAEKLLERIGPAIREVTLHASFVQYGSVKRRKASLDGLERIASSLEEKLFSVEEQA
jgi:hypothetical protein